MHEPMQPREILPVQKQEARDGLILGRGSDFVCHIQHQWSDTCHSEYGAGLRLLECARLRVKDVDFAKSALTVQEGKGAKDRVTVLPASVREDLPRQIERARIAQP